MMMIYFFSVPLSYPFLDNPTKWGPYEFIIDWDLSEFDWDDNYIIDSGFINSN